MSRKAKQTIKSCLVFLLGIVVVFTVSFILSIIYDNHSRRKEEDRFYSLVGKPFRMSDCYKEHKDDIDFYRSGLGWRSALVAYLKGRELDERVNVDEATESYKSGYGVYVLRIFSCSIFDCHTSMVLIFVDENGIVKDVIFVRGV